MSAVVEGTEVNATVTGINLLSNNGDLVGVAANVSEADENTYVGIIGEVPSDTFIVELLGVDGNGFSFAHISDSAVEVTSINLAFGMFGIIYLIACWPVPLIWPILGPI